MTQQLVEHESGRADAEEKWWKHPVGFNLLDTGDVEWSDSAPPPGYERLPFHEEDLGGE